MSVAEQAWNKVRNAEQGDAEYSQTDPDFRGRLAIAVGEASQGRSSGIAGLEKFEQEAAKLLSKEKGEKIELRDVSEGSQTVDEAISAEGGSDSAGRPVVSAPSEENPDAKGESAVEKGSGAQGKEKALKDAAGAGSRLEASELHSPSAPSAARPLAAESPANRVVASKSGKKSGGSKRSKAGKKASK